MNQIFYPGQTVYAIFWRRPEDTKFNNVSLYATKRGRDNFNGELLIYGLITMTGTWKIPSASRGKMTTGKEILNLPASF